MRTEQIGKSLDSISLKNEDIKSTESKNLQNSFADTIGKVLNSVNDNQVKSNDMINSFIKGEDITMHQVMLSMQESQMSMQLLIEMRNKLVEAYQEINRVQL